MAIIFKVSPSMEAAMASFDKISAKSHKTMEKMAKDADKATKAQEKSNKQLMVAGVATLAFFWGVAQVSPVVNAMVTEMSAALGVMFDVIFTSLLPVFYPLMEALWNFAGWLQGQPEWLKMLIGFLILIPPILIAMYGAYKAYMTIKAAITTLENMHAKATMNGNMGMLLSIKLRGMQTIATIKAAIATRALNFAIMSGPLMILAAVIGGIAAMWYMTKGEVADNTEKIGELNQELEKDTMRLAGLRGELDLYFEGLGVVIQNTIDNMGGFSKAVDTVVAMTPTLPDTVRDELDTLLNGTGGFNEIMEEIIDIQQNAFGRDLTPSEISLLDDYYKETDKIMDGVYKVMEDAGLDTTSLMPFLSTQDTIKGTWDFLIDDLEILQDEFDDTTQTVLDLQDQLDVITTPERLARWEIVMGMADFPLGNEEQKYALTGGVKPWYEELFDWANPYDDFIIQPGKGISTFSPDDTVVGVKDPSMLGGGGGSSVSINIENNTFRDQADIDYLLNELERRMQYNIDRSV